MYNIIDLHNFSIDEMIVDSDGDHAVYLRKSRTDIEAELRGEGETLARHQKILLDLAEKLNIRIGKIYREIVSGDSIDARPKVQKLLNEVREGKWKGVLVVEIERLARGETTDQGIVAKAFKISDTRIVTPGKTYYPNDEFDEEYFEFGLFMSRREYKTINRRLQRGRVLSVNEGKYVGSVAPFGYDRVKITNGKGYTLKINEEAKIVKIIFNLYAYENCSIYEVARKLDTMGSKPRKNDKWSANTVKDILSNPVYIGKIKWNWRKVVKVYKDDKLISRRPRNSEYILIDGIHEAIIDMITWNIVQKRKSENKSPIVDKDVIKNSLCGIVICAKCGKKMKRRPYTIAGKEPTLFCDNPDCDNISSKLSIVEEKVIVGLREWLKDYKLNYLEHIQKINNNQITFYQSTIDSLSADLKKEECKLQSIFEYFEDGTYTKEMFKIRSENVSDEINKLKRTIEEYKEKIREEEGKVDDENVLAPKVENILEIYDSLETAEDKNRLLKTVLSKVTYLKTEKAIKKDSDPTNFIITLYPKLNKVNI